MNKLTCIMLTYNALDYTEKAVFCFLRDKDNYDQLIIVDNGSKQETLDYLLSLRKKNRDKIIFISNEENIGFPKAVNQALRETPKDNDVLISNNDIEFAPGTIRKLHKKAYELENCGVIVPRQLSTDGDLLCANSFTLPVDFIGYSNGNELFVNQYNTDYPTDVAMFCFTIIKRDVLDKVGLLSEDYFAYAEDSDFSVETQKAGYQVYYAGTINITHHHNITSRENKLDLSEIQKKGVSTFKREHGPHYEARYFDDLSIQVPFGHPTGYSRMSEYFAENLDRNGIRVHYMPIYGIPGNIYDTQGCNIHYNNFLKKRTLNPHGLQIMIGQADVFPRNSGDYRIGFTMFDTDKWPKEWVEATNKGCDEVWIPTNEGIEIAKESGVKIKNIFCIPLGVDPHYFHPDIKPLDSLKFISHKRNVNFLSVFEFGERKQPELLCHAWHRAFYKNPDIALYIKYTNSDPSVDVQRIISGIEQDYSLSKTKIHWITGDDYNGIALQDYLMGSLYKSFDAFVSPTAAEGFLLPAIESLAVGLPVGITGKFGYLPENTDMPGTVFFDYEMEKVGRPDCRCEYYHGTNWAKPKIDDVVDKLRYMYNNLAMLQEQALFASSRIRNELSWAKITTEKIIPRLKEIRTDYKEYFEVCRRNREKWFPK